MPPHTALLAKEHAQSPSITLRLGNDRFTRPVTTFAYKTYQSESNNKTENRHTRRKRTVVMMSNGVWSGGTGVVLEARRKQYGASVLKLECWHIVGHYCLHQLRGYVQMPHRIMFIVIVVIGKIAVGVEAQAPAQVFPFFRAPCQGTEYLVVSMIVECSVCPKPNPLAL